QRDVPVVAHPTQALQALRIAGRLPVEPHAARTLELDFLPRFVDDLLPVERELPVFTHRAVGGRVTSRRRRRARGVGPRPARTVRATRGVRAARGVRPAAARAARVVAARAARVVATARAAATDCNALVGAAHQIVVTGLVRVTGAALVAVGAFFGPPVARVA